MLHLVNGETTLARLRAANLPGELHSGDDLLMEGPVPNGLRAEPDWAQRAEYLESRFGAPAAEYVDHARARLRLLGPGATAAEVVLWFEEDLFCQVNFTYLLHALAASNVLPERLAIVCPPAVRLATLPADELTRLFDARQPVSAERLALADRVWRAYCAPDPTALAALRAGPQPAWPFLAGWIELHLQRFPSLGDGLNVIERAILRALAAGEQGFEELFAGLARGPDVAPYGLGDLQVARAIMDLAGGPWPAVELAGWGGAPPWQPGAAPVAAWRARLTAPGAAYLAGRDFIAANGIDRHLGGVHLTGRTPPWRWAGETRTLVRAAG